MGTRISSQIAEYVGAYVCAMRGGVVASDGVGAAEGTEVSEIAVALPAWFEHAETTTESAMVVAKYQLAGNVRTQPERARSAVEHLVTRPLGRSMRLCLVPKRELCSRYSS